MNFRSISRRRSSYSPLLSPACLVHSVCLVCLVYLVSLVCLLESSASESKADEPDKRDVPESPDGPTEFFRSLLEHKLQADEVGLIAIGFSER